MKPDRSSGQSAILGSGLTIGSDCNIAARNRPMADGAPSKADHELQTGQYYRLTSNHSRSRAMTSNSDLIWIPTNLFHMELNRFESVDQVQQTKIRVVCRSSESRREKAEDSESAVSATVRESRTIPSSPVLEDNDNHILLGEIRTIEAWCGCTAIYERTPMHPSNQLHRARPISPDKDR